MRKQRVWRMQQLQLQLLREVHVSKQSNFKQVLPQSRPSQVLPLRLQTVKQLIHARSTPVDLP
jgi:hypothetical protein